MYVEVTSGDKLILLKTAINDHFRVNTSDSMTEISCTLSEILHNVQQGHRVFIDDGKIEAVGLSHTKNYLVLKIVPPSDTTAKIKTEKDLNFPDSELAVAAITAEDIENLDFIVNHATAVEQSFVHSSKDIQDLYDALVRWVVQILGSWQRWKHLMPFIIYQRYFCLALICQNLEYLLRGGFGCGNRF
ncbi:MAG: pyruvate kinase [Nitrososphaeraceae archaeon]